MFFFLEDELCLLLFQPKKNRGKVDLHPPKTNMDTNDGLEKVTPFKSGDFWYPYLEFLGCI